MKPYEVRKLDNKKCIVMIRGCDPVIDFKFNTFRHPRFQRSGDGEGKWYMQNQEGCLKANASVILNDVFKVTGIRIGISQKGNVFVSMPDYKTGRLDDNGKDVYQDIAYPVTRQFRQELYEEIVKKFKVIMEQEG